MSYKLPVGEADLLRIERELDEMGWQRRECGYWEDPVTGSHEPSSRAYEIAIARLKRKRIRIYR